MVLSELTNKELKGILRENDVRNYSKMNKKGLLKKVNQLIKEQNGGKSKKKYRLRGGSPKKGNQGDTAPLAPAPAPLAPAPAPGAPATAPLAPAPAVNSNLTNLKSNKQLETTNTSKVSAPPLVSDPSTGPPRISTGNQYLNAYYNPKNPKNVRLVNPEFGSNPPNKVTNNNQNNANKNKPNDECGGCSIL